MNISYVVHSNSRAKGAAWGVRAPTDNLCTKILDFGGFDSSIILILRGGMLMSIRNFAESLSQGILVGIILVGIILVGIILVGIILEES